MTTRRLRDAMNFIQHHEASGGVILLAAAVAALILANSPLAPLYGALLDTHVSVRIGEWGLDKNLLHWINDGLMAIFFFHVGLEIKRELVEGELSTLKQAALPAVGALGGMICPALIYTWINWGDPHALRGWAIPTATDIAFAVGVLALLGPRIPASLKILLLAIAILDDLGAIVIIAVFYTSDLSLWALAAAAAGIVGLAALNARGVTRTAAYVLMGAFVWLCVLQSGVHATLAGVITAIAVPLLPVANGNGGSETLAARLQDSLHPWVAFGVLPAFAFANAGVSLAGLTPEALLSPIPLGIALGLLIGKAVGVYSFTTGAIALGIGTRPENSTRLQLFGIAVLAGIGFTMSLFIGMLAFPDPQHAADVRIGVLSGSLCSALLGFAILRRAKRPLPKEARTG